MTNQEAFNKAWIGLKDQGFKRSANGGRCLYRGPNNTKCAIGHLLSDEQFAGEDCAVFFYCEVLKIDSYFGIDLQDAHDNGNGCMEDNLKKLALDYGLTIPHD